jgi:LuxR family maltose regulon positive regulatory protein
MGPVPQRIAASPADPLLATRLFIPARGHTLLDRPRLLARLTEILRRPLTLVAAPPGWGKTTLLSTWAAATPDVRVAWVSLEVGDNDPARFWRYVILALQQAMPGIGEGSLARLRSHRPAAIEAVMRSLLNALSALENDVALIMDDYHVIDTAVIHDALTMLIDHLPPRLHLVLATRADPPLPLARMRARGALLEVRADDLRFTMSEADQFLSGRVDSPLSNDMIAALQARTEGWIAGLQLAALAMQDHREPASFIAAFSGSHRFVADYLVEEVLLRQAAEVQDFLIRTSILDRMCAPVCQALNDTDATDDARDAQHRLEQLDRANLFLVPLDAERQWYRYHHLFGDLLRARLRQERPRQVATLHRRASEWFEHAGFAEEAIHHAIRAGDFQRAAALLEPIADPLWMDGQMATLDGWLSQLPLEVRRLHPHLLVAQAGAMFFLESRRIGAIEASLDEAEEALSSGRTDLANVEMNRTRGRIHALRASQASWQDDTARTLVLSREALGRLESKDRVWRLLALTAFGMAYALRGEPLAAIPPLTEAARLSDGRGVSYVGLGPLLWLGLTRIVEGKPRKASAAFQRGLDRIGPHVAENLTAANFLIGLGGLEYEQNQLDAAERHLVEGIRLAGRQQWPWVLVDACSTLAQLKILRGDARAADDLLERMERHAAEVQVPWPWMAPRLAASMGRAWLAFGDTERAAAWALQFDTSGPSGLDYSVEIQRITAARLLLAQGQPARALAELDGLLSGAESHGRWGRVIEIQVLRALSLEQIGRREDSLVAVGKALALGVPEGYVRRFLDEGPVMHTLLRRAEAHGLSVRYIRTLPSAGGDRVIGVRPGDSPREPLSDRERAVLQLLVAGRSSPEIAAALIVAPSTVRTHLKSIYGKLDVHSRDQAIARVRQLKLV